jgi:hypothetical protein
MSSWGADARGILPLEQRSTSCAKAIIAFSPLESTLSFLVVTVSLACNFTGFKWSDSKGDSAQIHAAAIWHRDRILQHRRPIECPDSGAISALTLDNAVTTPI